MGTFIRRLFKTILALIVIIIVALTILVFAGVTLDLSKFRGAVEASIEAALDREIDIDGPVYLEFSNWPAIDIEDVKLANVEGASTANMLEAGMVRLQIGLFPILKGEIDIAEITLEDVYLNLETDTEGMGNWVFKNKKDNAKDVEAVDETVTSIGEVASEKKKLISFTGLHEISLKNISVNYLDKTLNKVVDFQLDSLVGEASGDTQMKMVMSGHVQDKTYDLNFLGGSVDELFNRHKPWAFTLNGEVINREVAANGDMRLRDNSPEMNLALAIKQVDVGAVLEALGLVEGMQASLGDMAIEVSVNGNSLKEILENSTMLFKVNDADWKVTVPNSSAVLEITDISGDVLVEKGNAVTMEMDGKLKGIPIKLLVTGAPMVDYVSKPDSIPLTIDAALLDSRISFASTVKLPMTDRNMSMSLKFTSKRLDRLNKLLNLDLPAMGPVSLTSKLTINRAGYDMPALDLVVGKSDLKGKFNLDTSSARPDLNIELISNHIRLEDFDSLRSNEEKEQRKNKDKGADEAKDDAGDKAEEKTDESDDTKSLMSFEVLNALNANIKVEAKKVTAETDSLGAALLKVSLKDARLAVEPLRVEVPAGKMQLEIDYTLTPASAALNVKGDIEEFNITTLVRRTKPESDMGGLFTLDVDLHSIAPDPQSIMKYANGKIDFALVPKNFSSGVIDLWAVNLLAAIMDKSTERDESVINCVVVRFGIKDGVMEEKAIYLDTTNMRIAGKAEINFVEEEIDIKLAPKAKNPEFFNVAVPIKLKGSFEDFGIKIGIFRMAGQIVSFVTSPVHVPVRRVFTEEEPADGVEACKIAWTRTAGKEKGSQVEKSLKK
ncbi:MAG: AsmA family protein [Arenicellales bacterium]